MIQRYLFVKLRDDEVASRAELADKLRAELGAAGIEAIVGLPADGSAARWDLAIAVTAASRDAWHAVAHLPAFAAIVNELHARAEVVKAWTFEAP